jgi:hypothetical protein
VAAAGYELDLESRRVLLETGKVRLRHDEVIVAEYEASRHGQAVGVVAAAQEDVVGHTQVAAIQQTGCPGPCWIL